MKKIIFLIITLFMICISAQAKDFNVILSWDANIETDLAGYRVYRSETSGSGYVQISIDSVQGLSTLYTDTITVNDGEIKTYYYAVTAFDQSNLESDYSNEVNDIFDGNEPPAPPANLIINIQVVISLRGDGTYRVAMQEIK